MEAHLLSKYDKQNDMADNMTDISEASGNNGESAEGTIRAEIYDWLQCIVAAILACILIFTFAIRHIGVQGDSMKNTLHNKDRVIISNLFYTPKYGDIVVLRKEEFRDEPVIKRVIATEGQTIDINFETGQVFVDGKALQEDYIAEPTRSVQDFYGPVTIPEGHVFVMGDNRNHSTDSRTMSLGTVDERYIMGRLLFRMWPMNVFGKVD